MRKRGGWGADVAFECSGSPKSYETFWKLIAPGGAAVIVGIPVSPVAIDITELQATEVRNRKYLPLCQCVSEGH